MSTRTNLSVTREARRGVRGIRLGLMFAALCLALPCRADERVRIEAKVNGQPVHLAFDTGFGGALMLWRGVTERLGLKIILPPAEFRPAPGEIATAHSSPATVEIMGRTFPDVQFAVFDPPNLSDNIDGLVGWPALSHNIIILRVTEHEVKSVDEVPPEVKQWTKLRVLNDRKTLMLELPPSDESVANLVLVDTGFPDGVKLSADRWRAFRKTQAQQPATLNAYYALGAGVVVSEELWAHTLRLNGLILRDVPVMSSSTADPSPVGAGYAATVGLAALARLDLVIDGKQGVAYAHPREDPPHPYAHNRLGAVFVPPSEQSNDLAARVAANSPATVAGIRDGDVLLAIDQLDVTKWRTQPGILPVTHFWTQPAGTQLVLTLRRGSATIKKAAVLADILSPAIATG